MRGRPFTALRVWRNPEDFGRDLNEHLGPLMHDMNSVQDYVYRRLISAGLPELYAKTAASDISEGWANDDPAPLWTAWWFQPPAKDSGHPTTEAWKSKKNPLWVSLLPQPAPEGLGPGSWWLEAARDSVRVLRTDDRLSQNEIDQARQLLSVVERRFPGEAGLAEDLRHELARHQARQNPIRARFGGPRGVEIDVFGPTWPGAVKYWDARFVDGGEEGTIPAVAVYGPQGRWSDPQPKKAGKPAWTNNPRNPGEWKVPPACDPEGTGRKLDVAAHKGQRVRVHVNLHNGCYVVSHKGRVAGYAKALTLKDAQPKVGVGGWNRCNETKVRNVHAYIEGVLVSAKAAVPKGNGWAKISYNCKAHTKPEFFYVGARKKTFEGAGEVRFVRKKGVGMAQIEVWARGRGKKSNPSCCELPGGACRCGAVERWWKENPNEIAPCGSAPKQVGVHVVRRPWGTALLLLDANNLEAYTLKDWYERGRCPLLAGFSGMGVRIARPSMWAELEHHESSGRDHVCRSLVDLASRCRIPIAQAEDLLCREGLAWHAAEGKLETKKNP
jgi:hypothetical protein